MIWNWIESWIFIRKKSCVNLSIKWIHTSWFNVHFLSCTVFIIIFLEIITYILSQQLLSAMQHQTFFLNHTHEITHFYRIFWHVGIFFWYPSNASLVYIRWISHQTSHFQPFVLQKEIVGCSDDDHVGRLVWWLFHQKNTLKVSQSCVYLGLLGRKLNPWVLKCLSYFCNI